MPSGVQIVSGLALLGSRSSSTAHLINWYALPSKLLTLREKTFAGVAFHEQRLVLVTKLVPKVVKVSIVWPEDNMRKLVQQCICDLLHRQKLSRIMMISQAYKDPLSAVDVEPCINLSRRSLQSQNATHQAAAAHLVETQLTSLLSSRACASWV